jgi:hypothetical protein
MTDLRAAVEALTQWRPHGAWDDGWNAAVAASRALIDAHQCYDVETLAKALCKERGPKPSFTSDALYVDDECQALAAAIIAQIEREKNARTR